MKIQTRKIVERTLEYTDNITGKKEKIKESYENGFVEELEVSLSVEFVSLAELETSLSVSSSSSLITELFVAAKAILQIIKEIAINKKIIFLKLDMIIIIPFSIIYIIIHNKN